jgi:hypothetical protein
VPVCGGSAALELLKRGKPCLASELPPRVSWGCAGFRREHGWS